MTTPLPRDLALSLYGGCLAEPFQDRLRKMKHRKLVKIDHLGPRKRAFALVSVKGRELLCGVVTGSLYDPITGVGLGGNAKLKL